MNWTSFSHRTLALLLSGYEVIPLENPPNQQVEAQHLSIKANACHSFQRVFITLKVFPKSSLIFINVPQMRHPPSNLSSKYHFSIPRGPNLVPTCVSQSSSSLSSASQRLLHQPQPLPKPRFPNDKSVYLYARAPATTHHALIRSRPSQIRSDLVRRGMCLCSGTGDCSRPPR